MSPPSREYNNIMFGSLHYHTNCSRLRPIVDTLFPRSGGGRGLQPKDLPPNTFVKIIHYIARVSSSVSESAHGNTAV